MGSRAVVIVCRDEEAARERFGVVGEGSASSTPAPGGASSTMPASRRAFLARVRTALDAAGLWESSRPTGSASTAS